MFYKVTPNFIIILFHISLDFFFTVTADWCFYYSLSVYNQSANYDVEFFHPPKFFKFTCDVSWNDHFSPAVTAIIFTSNAGHRVHGITRCVWCSSTLTGEARDVRRYQN